MSEATVHVVGEGDTTISRFVFGVGIESIARVTYGGVWDRERNIARADVKAAAAAMGPTRLRWPGSSSAASYHWRDGIGPVDERPFQAVTWWADFGAQMAKEVVGGTPISANRAVRIGNALGPAEPNLFGTDEFLQYCVDLGAEPMLSINIGGGTTPGEGTPEEAAGWVRYCNVDGKAPRRVDWWQFGNEVMAGYEPGHAPPDQYAERVRLIADAMRAVDPTIKIVAVASTFEPTEFTQDFLDTFMDATPSAWNRTVFSALADTIDAVSFSWYYPGMIDRDLRDDEPDTLQLVTAGEDLGRKLDFVISELETIGPPAAALPITLGEWGRQVKFPDHHLADNHRRCDGVYFAGCYNRILERAARVRAAHLSMLVNLLAPIQTDGDRHFVTAAYHVARMYRYACRRNLAGVRVQSSTFAVEALDEPGDTFFLTEIAKSAREAATLDAVATTDDGGASVFLINRALDEPAAVTLTGLPTAMARGTFRYVTSESPWDRNSIDNPDVVRMAEVPVDIDAGRAVITLPACTSGVLIAGAIEAPLADD